LRLRARCMCACIFRDGEARGVRSLPLPCDAQAEKELDERVVAMKVMLLGDVRTPRT
jgi:hypothetical protein